MIFQHEPQMLYLVCIFSDIVIIRSENEKSKNIESSTESIIRKSLKRQYLYQELHEC